MTTPTSAATAMVPVETNHGPAAQGDGSIGGLAKAITDLDGLVNALIRTMPSAKPWQRTLIDQLANADREIQVLRMTIALDRSEHELRTASTRLHETLALANALGAKSRADSSTKAAVRLAASIAKQISEACRADPMRSEV